MPQRKRPLLLFRGDSRHPEEIFESGFTAKGSDTSILAHALGGRENLDKSGYISTSATIRIPANFIAEYRDPQGNEDWFNWRDDPRSYVRRFGWVYQIKPTDDLEMVYVSDELGQDPETGRFYYKYEQEWAVVHHIPGKNIKGAQRIDGYAVLQNFDDGWGLYLLSPPDVMIYHEFITNPGYVYSDYEKQEHDKALSINTNLNGKQDCTDASSSELSVVSNSATSRQTAPIRRQWLASLLKFITCKCAV